MQDIALIISTTLMYSTPLIFAALGGVFSENSGIVNIGIEGMMTIGAFAGAAAGYMLGNPWLAFIIGGLAGGLFALVHALATVTFNADHTISGVAINLLAPGVALFASKIMFDGATMTPTIPMEQNTKTIKWFIPIGKYIRYNIQCICYSFHSIYISCSYMVCII